MKAFWNYYLTVNGFNLPACIVISIFSGMKWLPIGFCTYGTIIGLLCFNFFFKNQYYFYYNIGYSRKRLATILLIANLVTAPFLQLFISLILAWLGLA